MHIVDGALAHSVSITGAALTVGGLAVGLRALPLERIPATGVLSACFFVASLIHVPIGPTSVHLMLNGLAGLLLGWAAFPALFVGLILQTVFFGFGGLTVLGVNTINIALPAVITWMLFHKKISTGSTIQGALWGAIGAGFTIAMTATFVAFSLTLSGDEFIPAAKFVVLAHIPIMIIEGILTGFAIYFLRKVKPEIFETQLGAAS